MALIKPFTKSYNNDTILIKHRKGKRFIRMKTQDANDRIVANTLFRLLPVQIMLAAVGAVNGLVSGFFASNYVGVEAMSAVGLYSPLNMLITSISSILVGGSIILCGKYLGRNQPEKMQNIFSLNLFFSILIASFFIVLFLVLSLFDLTGFLVRDEAARPIFNRYLLGQTIGIIPSMLGYTFSSFLTFENKRRQNTTASLIYIAANLALNYVFVRSMHMEAFGLALASSLGLWIFLGVQLQAFITGKTHLHIQRPYFNWKESAAIFSTGVPNAAFNVYQTLRSLAVIHLLEVFVGVVGISAFTAADSFVRLFLTVPTAMLTVSRLMISVSVGEEDRQTLTGVTRVMFKGFIPLMCAICAGIILCAVPATRLFFRDPAEPVYMMTVWGVRILPLYMPLSIICKHFTCYWQASGRLALVHILSLLDGVVCVTGFTALLIRSIGTYSVYTALVLNGIVTTAVILGYAWFKNKHFPRNMQELMVIPESFGVPESERMDLSIKSMEEVVSVAENIQTFCLSRGIDSRRSYMAALSMEEMAGNVVDHGFTKDKKQHSIDIRVVHKHDTVILCIRDDCIPFDPIERMKMTELDDTFINIGIRMIYNIALDVQYRNILGMNVLTIKI